MRKKRSLLKFETLQQDTEVERSSPQPIPLYLHILSHLLLHHLPCFLRDLIRSSTPFLFLLDLPLCWLVNVMRRSRAALIEKKLGPKDLPLQLIHCSPSSLHQSLVEQISLHHLHHLVAMCRCSTLQQVPSLIMRGGLLPLPLSHNHLDSQL